MYDYFACRQQRSKQQDSWARSANLQRLFGVKPASAEGLSRPRTALPHQSHFVSSSSASNTLLDSVVALSNPAEQKFTRLVFAPISVTAQNDAVK